MTRKLYTYSSHASTVGSCHGLHLHPSSQLLYFSPRGSHRFPRRHHLSYMSFNHRCKIPARDWLSSATSLAFPHPSAGRARGSRSRAIGSESAACQVMLSLHLEQGLAADGPSSILYHQEETTLTHIRSTTPKLVF